MRTRDVLVITAVAMATLVACDRERSDGGSPSPTAATSATSTTTSTASPTPAPTATTEVIRFLPPQPAPSTAQDGSCFAGSASLGWREDAYRCTVGNSIQDPCFALPGGAVVCGANPTRADATPFILRLTQPLPAHTPNAAQIEAGKKNGWLVKLANGTVCGFLTGATGGFEGQRLNYGCTDGTTILGDLVPGTPWTARFVTGKVGPNGFEVATSEIRALATVYQ